MREILISAYLDYLNNYLSITTYAEHNGLTQDQALKLIDLAREVHMSEHPEA